MHSADEALTPGLRQFVADDLLSVAVVPGSDGTSVTVSPTGDIDSLTAPALRSALLSLLQPPCTRVMVDLDGATFLNSAGLTVLAEAHHLAQAGGIVLGVRGGGRAVLRSLQFTGVGGLLTVPPG
jgi:anti-sigma B factor antagonist